ncbi:hypothetical protein NPIL_97231 [Nephila pilipes]|uniref:Tetratricopeptide repeat protein n=1 Tax=Nephila pilipes TaxID=299642 RepID=A0A8X6NKN7_NEPPI|nr:hypothetical protein NPIL_97231 [Nephila pilipes]
MLKYLEKKPFESSKVKKDQMASLGLDPYKIYSFHKPIDGKKYQGPRDLSSWSEKMKKMKISIELLNDYASAYKISDYTSALSLLDQAIENWPMNDSAFAYKGRIFKDLWKLEKKSSHISMAIDNSVRALKLNPNCLIAKNDLHDIYVTSLKTVSKENSTVLQQLIMQIAADNDCSLKWKNSSGLFEKDIKVFLKLKEDLSYQGREKKSQFLRGKAISFVHFIPFASY